MFEYLSTADGVTRFIFTVLIGFCVLEGAIAFYRGLKERTNV